MPTQNDGSPAAAGEASKQIDNPCDQSSGQGDPGQAGHLSSLQSPLDLDPSLADVIDIPRAETPPALTNRAFLDAMLPGIPEGECAWTCAFKQAPEEGRWRGWPVVEDRPPSELTVHNNYFCVASVKLPEGEDAGEAPSRKKSSFGRLFVAPIDDIVGGLPLPPSCILQTSPNKRQAFYRLDPPIDNPKVAECLMKELIRSGRLEAADKGGCNIIRYMRLPVGCNSKASHVAANGGEPSLVRLVEWHPERGYSLVELVEGFALDRDYVEGRVQRSSEKRRKQAKEAASNNILAALKAKGLYRLAKGDGVHEILCPWAKAHTSGDGGTAYFQPSEENPRGGFKCQHGHCADRHLKDLCAALGVESPAEEDESGRPLIFLRAGARNEIIAQVERTFADNDQVFARSGTLVKPTLIKECIEAEAAGEAPRAQPGQVVHERDPGQLALLIYNPVKMLNSMAESIAFRAWNGEEWGPADPPAWLAQGIVEDASVWKRTRPISAITSIPVLQLDGSVWSTPGWHQGTALFYRPKADPLPLPERCTREEAQAALERFAFFVSAYPFAGPAHRAAVLAMALAGLARHLFDAVPYLHIDAPKQGSGKTLIARSIGVLALGVLPGDFTFPADPEETRKVLTTCLKKGDAVIVLDNAADRRVIEDPSLAKAVTSEKHSDRLLCQNESVDVKNAAIIIGTGNNNLLAGDLPRRTLMPRIEPEVEAPEDRAFSFDPVAWCLTHREEMVRDGLTVLAAYLRAGRPGESEIKPWGSFEDFKLVRGVLRWLGEADPREARPAVALDDSNEEEHEAYLRIWEHVRERESGDQRKGAPTFTAKEVEPLLTFGEHPLAFFEGANIGSFLAGRRGQVKCGGLVIRDTGRKAKGGRTLWRIDGAPSAEALEERDG